MSSKKEIKRQDQHLINVELNQLKDLIPLVKEYKSLLKELEVSSIAEFELKINERSGFVNASMSATAYGLEIPYKRLLEMQKSLDGKLSLEDLTPTNKLKPTIIEIVIDLCFFSKELKMCEKKSKPDTDPIVKKIKTFNRYNLSGSLMNSKLNEIISISVK